MMSNQRTIAATKTHTLMSTFSTIFLLIVIQNNHVNCFTFPSTTVTKASSYRHKGSNGVTSPSTRIAFGLESKVQHTLDAGSIKNTTRRNLASESSENEESSNASQPTTTPKRRRKRKDGKNVKSIENQSSASQNETIDNDDDDDDDEKMNIQNVKSSVTPEPEPASVAEPVPKSSKPVKLQIVDIRDAVSGGGTSASTSTYSVQSQTEDEEEDDDEYEYYYDDDDDDDEYEYYYEDEDNNEVIVGTGSKDTSLEALLADAKRMRQEDAASFDDEGSGVSIPATIRSVISTIVTVDFFVVCALLAWFLAGIFCSYVIKDDTVQIAFNGIFEPVVQPALGVLMIGSAAGAVFKEPEKE